MTIALMNTAFHHPAGWAGLGQLGQPGPALGQLDSTTAFFYNKIPDYNYTVILIFATKKCNSIFFSIISITTVELAS